MSIHSTLRFTFICENKVETIVRARSLKLISARHELRFKKKGKNINRIESKISCIAFGINFTVVRIMMSIYVVVA